MYEGKRSSFTHESSPPPYSIFQSQFSSWTFHTLTLLHHIKSQQSIMCTQSKYGHSNCKRLRYLILCSIHMPTTEVKIISIVYFMESCRLITLLNTSGLTPPIQGLLQEKIMLLFSPPDSASSVGGEKKAQRENLIYILMSQLDALKEYENLLTCKTGYRHLSSVRQVSCLNLVCLMIN